MIIIWFYKVLCLPATDYGHFFFQQIVIYRNCRGYMYMRVKVINFFLIAPRDLSFDFRVIFLKYKKFLEPKNFA